MNKISEAMKLRLGRSLVKEAGWWELAMILGPSSHAEIIAAPMLTDIGIESVKDIMSNESKYYSQFK